MPAVRSTGTREQEDVMRTRSIGRAAWPLLLAAAAACQAPEPVKKAAEDPAAEQRRRRDEQNDQWWQWLAAAYDRNHDGKIEPSEYGRDPSTFARLDRDHDGAITRADLDREVVPPPDLVLPMMLLGIAGEHEAESVAIDRALEAMRKLDANGDGHIDRAEFEAAVPPFMPGVDRFATFLAGMDEDHDGLLSLPEIERWMGRRDADHDGRLARRERMSEGPAPAEGFIRRPEREKAPEFAAAPLGGGAPVPLASLVGEKPVALIFGSFT
jgi:Ca2+-binding EF-hand superfamily protein